MLTGRRAKKWGWFICATALAAAFAFNPPVMADPVEMKTETWRVAEIAFESTVQYDHPFEDVEVNVTFVGPGNQVLTRPAYWDGGTTWKVRFAPTRPGAWKYTTSATDEANAGLHRQSGKIVAVPYKGDLDIYKRGFLKVSDTGRYLTYADGTPFFYLGDTHWILPHERFTASNVPGVESQFKYTVDKRVSQGFTVFQSEPIWQPHGGDHSGPDEEAAANLSDGFSEADLDGFRNLDRKFQYIADRGLVHANAMITWALDPANYPVYTEEYMYKLARYWVARYGAYPVIWTIAQEIDQNMYGAYNGETMNKWYAVGQSILDHDAYDQPIMPHMENISHTRASTSSWADKPYHDGWAIQWQGEMTGMSIAQDFWNASPAKPSVLYEAAYDHFWTDSRGALGAAYKAFQYGFFGYGYGAAGVWNDIYSKPGEAPDYGTAYEMPARYYWWYDGANLPAADQLKYFKQFYTALEWWKLVPRFNDNSWSSFHDASRSLLSSDGQETFVVFFFNNGTETGVLKQLDAGSTYHAAWFDPRTGLYYPIPTEIRVDEGNWCIPSQPSSDDWVLLVEKGTIGREQAARQNEADLDPSIRQAILDSLLAPGCPETPDDGELPEPLGLWHLDEQTADVSMEASGGPAARLINGASVAEDGFAGSALALDGADDYAAIDDPGLLDGADQYSIALWVKLAELPQQHYSLIGKESSGPGGVNSFRIIVDSAGSGHFVLSTQNTGWYSTLAAFATRLQPGTWYHIAATYDGSNARIYINGNEEGMSNPVTGPLSSSGEPVRLGYKAADNIDFTNGMIDEVQIYDTALSQQQVMRLYESYVR
jgi:hypothetical protein